jgi:hypothetical protein
MRITLAAAFALILSLGACSPPATVYSYPAWGFAASFPDVPKVTDTPAPADGSQGHTFLVESSVSGRDFAVTVADASQSPNPPDKILDDARDLVGTAMGADAKTQAYVAMGQVTGREIRYSKGGKPLLVMREFVTNQKLYEVGGASILGLDDPSLKSFLDSFKFIPVAPATNAS